MEGNSNGSSASTFETQTIGGADSAASINIIQHLSSRSLQLTVEWLMYLAKVLEAVDL